MKKAFRLKRPADFKKTYKEGRRFRSPHFVLYVRENPGHVARLGVSIAKAHAKLASRRNRLRRVAKETFRTELLKKLDGYNVVVSLRYGAGQIAAGVIEEELKELLRRARPEGNG